MNFQFSWHVLSLYCRCIVYSPFSWFKYFSNPDGLYFLLPMFSAFHCLPAGLPSIFRIFPTFPRKRRGKCRVSSTILPQQPWDNRTTEKQPFGWLHSTVSFSTLVLRLVASGRFSSSGFLLIAVSLGSFSLFYFFQFSWFGSYPGTSF